MNQNNLIKIPIENVLPLMKNEPDLKGYRQLRDALNEKALSDLINNPDIQEVLRMLAKV